MSPVRQRVVELCLLCNRAERLHGGQPQVEVAVTTSDYDLGVAGTRRCVLQDGVLGRRPVRLVRQRVSVVGGGPGKPKWVPGLLSRHAQAVLKPSQGHLVDRLRCARGDPRGPLVIRVPQKVEDDLDVHRTDPRLVDAVLQREGGGHALPVGHRARDGHCPSAGEVGGQQVAAGVPAGPSPRCVGISVAPGLRDAVVAAGAEPPRVEVGGVPPDVGWPGVNWSTFSARVSLGPIAGCSWSRISVPAIVLAQDRRAVMCSLNQAGPPCLCTIRCPVSLSWSSSVCTAMCGSCGTSVATSRLVPQGSPRCLGWPSPTCTITHSFRSCACSVTRAHWSSVVTSNTGVGA